MQGLYMIWPISRNCEAMDFICPTCKFGEEKNI